MLEDKPFIFLNYYQINPGGTGKWQIVISQKSVDKFQFQAAVLNIFQPACSDQLLVQRLECLGRIKGITIIEIAEFFAKVIR